MSKKNSYVMYLEWSDMLCGLPDELAAQLIKAIASYETGREYEIKDPTISAYFNYVILPKLKENDATYQARVDNANETARKRKEANRNQSQANESESQSLESVTVNDNVYVYENDNDLKETCTNVQVKKSGSDEPPRAPRDMKHKHGEFKKVLLTDKEFESLKADYGEDRATEAIAFLDAYIAEKGYKSKSHYLAIRCWVFDAIDEKKQKPPTARSGTTKFNNFEQRQYDYSDLERQILAEG